MKNNTIIEVTPQGFCGGVMKAIQIAKEVRIQHPEATITILGNLVHNEYVKKALWAMEIHMIEDPKKTRLELLEDVPSGIVIFTAHGVAPALYEKAKGKGLVVYDASCPFVLQTQKIVQEKLKEGYSIFYIGKNHHPEAESIYTLSDAVFLIEKEADIPQDIENKIFVTNQTTMSTLEIQELFDAIEERYPNALFNNEICNATRIRQEAILKLKDQAIDLLIVVGDPHSNNTNKLASIGKKAGIPRVLLVQTLQELKSYNLDLNEQKIAITSGASTPKYLTDQIVQYLKTNTDEPFDLKKVL